MKQVVYFVQAGNRGPIKIGCANDVTDRVRSLCTACPSQLRILATIAPSNILNEKSLHQRFEQHRLEGEWFRPEPELKEFIKAHASKWVGAQPVSRVKMRAERRATRQQREKEREAARTAIIRGRKTRDVVTCRILPSLIRKLDELATADNRSRSEMIETAVRELIDRADKRKRGAK